MEFVVNDTNIFFDLMHTDLLDAFFQLDITVYTTDFIVAEIEEPEQTELIENLIEDEKVIVGNLSIDAVEEISLLNEKHTGLSIEDCSVWYFSKQNNFTLITGDGLLRKCATNDGVEVKGILYILDELVDKELIIANTAADKLDILLDKGTRLPQDECDKQIKRWSK